MKVHGLAGLARALLAAAAMVGLSGCPDDDGGGVDMAVADMAVATGDMAASNDMAMAEPSTGQVTFADVVGTAWIPFMDGGVPQTTLGLSPNSHAIAVIASLPANANSAQHASGSTLEGCTWNRYNLATGPFPAPDENGGGITVTGYHTATMRQFTGSPPQAPFATTAPDDTIKCAYNAATFHYDCIFDPSMTSTGGIFPEFDLPGPTLMNRGFVPTGTAIKEDVVGMGSWTAANAGTNGLQNLPDRPGIVTVNTMAGTHSLTDVEGLFNGAQDIVIEFSCDGTNVKGAGCPAAQGTLTGLLVETHLGKKWEIPSSTNMLRARFGTLQCVSADNPAAPHQFTITRQMQMDVLGADSAQTLRLVLVRLRASPQISGEHTLFFTAGNGKFGYITQN